MLVLPCFNGLAMEQLDTPPAKKQTIKEITLISNDGRKFTVKQDLIEHSSVTIRNMLEDITDIRTPIPLPIIDGTTLESIITCIEDPEGAPAIIMSLHNDQLWDFINAVSYLDIHSLFQQLPGIAWLSSALPSTALHTLTGHTDYVVSVAISPDARFVLTGSHDRTAKIWDVATGTCLHTLAGHTGSVYPVAISPDGRFVLTGSDDRTAKIWNMATGTCLRTLAGHIGHISAVAVSPDNKFILTGSWDHTAKIWDVATGKCLGTLKHAGFVKQVAISPDGKFVLTGSGDHTAKIWDVATGKCLGTLAEHTTPVWSVAISPDSRFVLTGSLDQTAKIWLLPNSRELASLLPPQIFLISLIQQRAAENKKLDLSPQAYTNLIGSIPVKDLAAVFETLPQNIKTVLTPYIIH